MKSAESMVQEDQRINDGKGGLCVFDIPVDVSLGDNLAEAFSSCSGDECSSSEDGSGSTDAGRRGSLFKEFETWLQPKLLLFCTLRRLARDKNTIRTFRSQERDYWRDREFEAEQRRHMAAHGDLFCPLRRATAVVARGRHEGASRA